MKEFSAASRYKSCQGCSKIDRKYMSLICGFKVSIIVDRVAEWSSLRNNTPGKKSSADDS